MRKHLFKSLTLLLLTFSLAACANNESTATSNVSLQIDSNKKYVGFLIDTLQQDRWYKDKDMFEAAVLELGAEVKTMAANGSNDVQIKQAQLLIDEGVDVLVVVPYDAEATSVIVEMAHEAGVKVISYDRLIKNAEVDYYISFDNEKVGQLQAEEILKPVNKGKFAYIGGDQKDNNAILFRQGAMNVLQPLVDKGDIQIVYDEYAEGWREKEAEAHMTKALQLTGNDIQAVISANDSNASGALRALERVNLSVPISGQDADVPALQRIVKGTQTMTVYKPIHSIAQGAAKLAIQVANEEAISTETTTNNGKVEVPTILLEPTVVTKNNIKETVIKDKQVTEQEIYK